MSSDHDHTADATLNDTVESVDDPPPSAATAGPDASSSSTSPQPMTLIYPIRSLLSDVRPSNASPSSPHEPYYPAGPDPHPTSRRRHRSTRNTAAGHGNTSSENDTPTIQQRRTAQWQASMALTRPPLPVSAPVAGSSSQVDPLSGETSVHQPVTHYFSGGSAASGPSAPSGPSESGGIPSSPHTAPLLVPADADVDSMSQQADAQWEEEARLRQLVMQSAAIPQSPAASERAERLAKGGFIDIGPPITEQEYEEGRSSISGSRGHRRGPRRKPGPASQESDLPSDTTPHPISARFHHVETEKGHFILTGRAGKLERCEDEPIHAPGAVQGFGVLVALEEDVEGGNLVVRQVSENSTEILGLSPEYLFSLQCFSHVFTKSQANILWDNVQYLSEPQPGQQFTGAEEESPQVFLLSGFGEPGSADASFGADAKLSGTGSGDSGLSSGELSGSGTGSGSAAAWPGPTRRSSGAPGDKPSANAAGPKTTERKEWTCWCAAHRTRIPELARSQEPSGSGSGSLGGPATVGVGSGPPSSPRPGPQRTGSSDPSMTDFPSSFIILEFELEYDNKSPLYPSPSPPPHPNSTPTPNITEMEASSVQNSASGGSSDPRAMMRNSRAMTTSSFVTSSTAVSDAEITTALGSSTVTAGTTVLPAPSEVSVEVSTGHSDPPIPSIVAPTPVTATSLAPPAEDSLNSTTPTPSNPGAIPTTAPTEILTTISEPPSHSTEVAASGEAGHNDAGPSAEDILASTTNKAQPIRALERMRQLERLATQRAAQRAQARSANASAGGPGPSVGGGTGRSRRRAGYSSSGTLDVFAILAQINEQLSSIMDLQLFLEVAVGIIKDLAQFHRVLIYQFDEGANGHVVAELVDRTQSLDVYRGLHFPAGDIPPQARHLYKINKVRTLYDRDQTTARLVGRTKQDVDMPLDLTHSYLRAMSPIHLKYLGNMGVRSSMSISIMLFGKLWGLICCHSYGESGMRVSFPVRQMLRLMSDSISHNIERLSYTYRLQTRKLINTIPSASHPNGHIVSNAEDLLELFDADYGILVIGEGAKILGPSDNGQDVLIITEYLRVKQFSTIQVTTDILSSYPDIQSDAGPHSIAGVLHVPLSPGGRDFIAFLRKGQSHEVKWAGRVNTEGPKALEPRTSFKAWSEIVSSKSRAWTDEQLDTSNVLALVYGKFIDVWRQKESAIKATQLTNLLLSNASHEVRTPLNHIISYLELALNGPLDHETRDNLSMSHAASKNLLFTINDLLDLTRLETGKPVAAEELFNFPTLLTDCVAVYKAEAERREIAFTLKVDELPSLVVGDSKKVRQVVTNLTANALKYTDTGSIMIEAREFKDAQLKLDPTKLLIEIVVADTGCGIENSKLQSMFHELEDVGNLADPPSDDESPKFGLGMALVTRIIRQLRGQLRVDSKPGSGSRFTFIIPFGIPNIVAAISRPGSRALSRSSKSEVKSEIDDFIEAMASPAPRPRSVRRGSSSKEQARESALQSSRLQSMSPQQPTPASATTSPIATTDSRSPDNAPVLEPRVIPPTPEREKPEAHPDISPPLLEGASLAATLEASPARSNDSFVTARSFVTDLSPPAQQSRRAQALGSGDLASLRILIVEDDLINRRVLEKRLKMRGHEVLYSTNGQEAVDMIEKDREFDCILMDIQMPILDGFGAAQRIREIEKASPVPLEQARLSTRLNGGIPIIAVSASLQESQREFMLAKGMDAWILKPIDFTRLSVLKRGILDVKERMQELYTVGKDWEKGGWMKEATPYAKELPSILT
ncbi:hypothetical protein DL93DRAFT_2225171 [Clavulina sp. PMI_390]|nr:hypothetical protein DL93DRAFT_2225171 [Clavulina sp. PMI_390]